MPVLTIDFLIDGETHSFVELEMDDETDAMVHADAIAGQISEDYSDKVIEENCDEDEDEDES